MATADARDILGLVNNGPRVPAPKSKKKAHIESGPRLKGMQREARALQGDSVPPVTLTEAPRYKEKPNLPRLPARHWEQRPFVPGARDDELTLKHWKRANIGPPPRPFTQANGDDVDMDDDTIDSATQNGHYFPEVVHFEKYNVKVNVPTYTAEQYEEKLKDEDWTKEETDFLMDLCRNFDLRWIVIADRYVPEDISPTTENIKPPPDAEAMAVDDAEVAKKTEYRPRSMQELKKRYYTIAATMLEIQIPKSNMTPAEFQLYEKMSSFNAQIENTRKELAEKLFERTKDEAEEERVLLEELKRITMNEEDFLKMRRDLYSRLEPPPTKRSNGEEQSTAMYQTSTGLSALLQNLLAKEKRMKRPSLMPNGEGTPNSATDDGRNSQRWEKGRHPNQYSRRDTLDSNDGAAAGPQKKFSQSQPNIRRLTPDDEVKFGVSYPQERLTSGVAFRHEKATKVLQGKSSVQAQKISNALTELGIPPRLGMPTEKVCKEFERLVQAIHLLLDARKGVERVVLEVKILEDARRQRLGVPKEGEEGQEKTRDAVEVDGEAKVMADPEAEAEIDDSIVEADKPDQTDGAGDREDESKVEAEEPENEDEEDEQEDEQEDEADEDVENASDAEVDDSDAEQAQVSRKRRHEESPQVSENDDEDDTGVNRDDDDEQEDEELNAVDIEDEADSNADLGSHNDISEEEIDEDEANEEEVDQEEADQEEAEEADPEAEAEIEESEPPESARPGSAQSAVSRLKRSASVVSDASKAGSNRSGVGRKKRR
jgi:DNA methyltransferase 1-associated protein 1